MNVSAEAVANRLLEFAENSGLPMYNLKLQKLVYIAHGFSLALLDKPLICNHVKACQFGPTYPELYEKLRVYGSGCVLGRVQAKDSVTPSTEFDAVINGVWQAFCKTSGSELSARTRALGTPWARTWETQEYANIPDEWIKSHYQGLLQKTA